MSNPFAVFAEDSYRKPPMKVTIQAVANGLVVIGPTSELYIAKDMDEAVTHARFLMVPAAPVSERNAKVVQEMLEGEVTAVKDEPTLQ